MLLTESVRTHQSVRDAVDQKLGYGSGLTHHQAWAKLDNVEKVAWLLGELLISLLDHRLHIWHQNLSGPEWDPIYEGLAEIGRPLGEETADLLRWTIQNAQRGVAMTSVIPCVWSVAWNPGWTYSLVERWDENLSPESLKAPPFTRATVAPAAGRPRYPDCRLVVAELPQLTIGDLIETTSYNLWKAGASDQELDDFFAGVSRRPSGICQSLGEWVHFEGDAQVVARQLDPLATALGLDSSEHEFCALTPVGTLDQLEARLANFNAVRLRLEAGETMGQKIRSALRMGVDLILLRAEDVRDQEEWDYLLQAALTGHILIIEGEAPPDFLARLPVELERLPKVDS
ncbi:MAG: ATPase, T2SS/T4P/T4SS family [Vulcanimicrobiota bacterium]